MNSGSSMQGGNSMMNPGDDGLMGTPSSAAASVIDDQVKFERDEDVNNCLRLPITSRFGNEACKRQGMEFDERPMTP